MADAVDPVLKPADELRAAAANLRKLASEITLGRWEYQPGPPQAEIVAEEGGWIIATSRHVEDSDFRWIALMGPDKADVLADLLDEAGNLAHFADVMAGGSAEECSLSISERAALRLARSILGQGQS